MEIEAKILTRPLTAKYTRHKGKAGPGHRTIDGSFASYRKGTRMSGFRGCGGLRRRLKGIVMRPAQSFTVERLESRCVLNAGPALPPPPAHSPVESNGPSLVALIALPSDVHGAISRDDHSAAPDMGNHHVPLDNGYAPVSYNSGQSAIWVDVIFVSDPPPSYGYTGGGFFDMPPRPEYRPPSKQVAFLPLDGASAGNTTVGTDSSEAKVSEHANLSEMQTHEQSSTESAASRVAMSATTTQAAYPVAPLTVRTATLTPTPAATELLEFVLGKVSAANVAKLAGDPSQAAIAWASSAVQIVQAGTTGLPGGDLVADFVRGLPRLADMPLPSVQRAIETVMADIKLIGTEVSEWFEGIHFTPMVLAVTAATTGAGAATYLRRRGGREARDRDEEASSSWLFARLQTIPLEA
jgi:hypothetical protein